MWECVSANIASNTRTYQNEPVQLSPWSPSHQSNYGHTKKQECIPVGCIPPAHWPYLVVSYACPLQPCMPPCNHAPPWQPYTPPWQLCMPPLTTMHAPSNHACPPQQPRMPPATMHTLLATMHTPQTRHAPQQPRMPPGNHAYTPATIHTPLQPHMPPPSNHACPPQQPHMPPLWTDRHL